MKTDLKIDWATHEAAKYSVENWHYTRKMPVGKCVKIGVWESGNFIGCVLFSLGASAVIHIRYELKQTEVCELTRVALDKHKTPVSRIISIALRFLIKKCPKLRLVVSFADPSQNHIGGIYQAGNWIYTGNSAKTTEYYFNGDWRHVTDIYKRIPKKLIKELPNRERVGKYRYLMPLDQEMKNQVEKIRQPYPKRMKQGNGDYPSLSGGATPTHSLQKLT